jgi:hypothetical protein
MSFISNFEFFSLLIHGNLVFILIIFIYPPIILNFPFFEANFIINFEEFIK